MIRVGALLILLSGPAGAEAGLCDAAWARVAEAAGIFGVVTAAGVVQQGDWCVVEAPLLDVSGRYVPDWHMDRLRFRGSALGWIADGSGSPERLEVAVEGLRLVVQTGNAQMDWLLAAQARPNGIDALAALAWDPSAKALRLEALSLDFPGENRIEVSAVVTGVDLSSTGAMQMSLAGFALTEARLHVQTHGLFEGYALMALGSALLPPEGDMEAAAEGIRADLLATVGDLPGTSFPDASKAAMAALVGEFPNPSGDLLLQLQAEPGIGPVRFGGYAVTGMPAALAEAAPVFQGVTVDVDWTHADAP